MDNLLSIDVSGDGNCFYRALSYLTAGHELNHMAIRESIADIIETRGVVLDGVASVYDFREYIAKLRMSGNYEFVGEETALAAADLFGC
jgi:hypothetical protein